MRLFGGVGELVKEQDVELPVLTEAFQLDKPDGFDVHDLVLRLVVDSTAVDGLGIFVDKLDIQYIRVHLAHTVALSVSRQAMEEQRDVRLYIGADQAELIMLLQTKRCVFRDLGIVLPGELFEEIVIEISCSFFAIQPGKKCKAGDQKAAGCIIQPADGAQLQEDGLPFSDGSLIRELDKTVDPSRPCLYANHALGTELPDCQRLSVNMDGLPGLPQGAAQEFPLCHLPQGSIENHRRPEAEFHRDDVALFLSAPEQVLLPLFQKKHRAHRAYLAGSEAAEPVNRGVLPDIIIDGTALKQKAVIRGGEHGKIGCTCLRADGGKHGQWFIKQLLR